MKTSQNCAIDETWQKRLVSSKNLQEKYFLSYFYFTMLEPDWGRSRFSFSVLLWQNNKCNSRLPTTSTTPVSVSAVSRVARWRLSGLNRNPSYYFHVSRGPRILNSKLGSSTLFRVNEFHSPFTIFAVKWIKRHSLWEFLNQIGKLNGELSRSSKVRDTFCWFVCL